VFQGAKQGRLEAFERLCAKVEAPLYSYALRFTRNPSDAEDVAQEALLRLYRAMQGRRSLRAPRAYLFSVAHNLAMDGHRRGCRTPPPEGCEAPSPEVAVGRSLLRAEVERALDRLPEQQRAALLMREFGDLSYAEIANAMGAGLGQVKTWIYRARRRLSTLLDRDGQYIGPEEAGSRHDGP